MTRICLIAAAALFGATAASADTSQLAASAGIDPGAPLDAVAAAKFNRDGGQDARQTPGRIDRGVALSRSIDHGSPSLDARTVAHINASSHHEDWQVIVVDRRAGDRAAESQLAAQAHVSPDLSLDAIVRAKFNYNAPQDERQ